MKLRFAAQEDVPALLAVYSRYIPTCVTFEYALPPEAVQRILETA